MLIEFIRLKFQQGGIFEMSAILATLMVSLVIIVERAYRLYFQFDMNDSSKFMANIQNMVMNNSIENAIRACKKRRPSLLAYVLAEGLLRANSSSEEVEAALDHATLAATPRVTKLVPFLATTANVATLLGLLGTIHGLMDSFAAVATLTGTQKQEVLAQGISRALTATFFGLSTALLCLFAYGLLTMKQKQIMDDLNRNVARIMDLLLTRRAKLKGAK